MSSREEILNRLRGNVRETYDFPDLGFKKLEFADPVAQYIETTTTTAGARVFEIKPTDDINAKIREAYPDARIIASNIPGVLADLNPDTVERAQDLEVVDVASETLVLIVSRKNIVSNMHEAYERIRFNDYGFGTFISGPSKTADIEQSLVYGAQAARGLTVFLTE